jgi:hypothetical protein
MLAFHIPISMRKKSARSPSWLSIDVCEGKINVASKRARSRFSLTYCNPIYAVPQRCARS